MAAPETIEHPDGRVELRPEVAEQISSSPLYNEDLAPVPVAKRNWTTYNYAALWISMAHCIPTYMLSSGLISAGMNWWQALITILLGNTDRPDSDPAQLASRHEVRHPLPCFCARCLWDLRFKPAGHDARHRRLRLVWNSGLDWRRSTKHSFQCNHSGVGNLIGRIHRWTCSDRVAVVSAVLGNQHLHYLSRHGSAAKSGELGRAVSSW